MNHGIKPGIKPHLKLVGNISVMRQSSAAFPQLMTPLNTAETNRFCSLLRTKNMAVEQRPENTVLNTEKQKAVGKKVGSLHHPWYSYS